MLVVIAGILGAMLHFQIENADLNKKRYSSISIDIQSVSDEVEKLREKVQHFESCALSKYDNPLLRDVDNIFIILKRYIDRPAQLRHNTP